jgi:hypothetical protein
MPQLDTLMDRTFANLDRMLSRCCWYSKRGPPSSGTTNPSRDCHAGAGRSMKRPQDLDFQVKVIILCLAGYIDCVLLALLFNHFGWM